MPTPKAFRITVTEVFDLGSVQVAAEVGTTAQKITDSGAEVFSQSIPAQDFDITSFVLAINKRKRLRKARAGKEAAT